MLIPIIACLVVVAAVAAALVDDTPVRPASRWTPPWGPVPEPRELTGVKIGRRLPGYDPATVDAVLASLRTAYANLYEAAPPEVLAAAGALAEGPSDDPARPTSEGSEW